MKKIFILSSLIAVTLATPSFAEPTELDKKTVASKALVDTKQDIIPAGTTGDIVLYNGTSNGQTQFTGRKITVTLDSNNNDNIPTQGAVTAGLVDKETVWNRVTQDQMLVEILPNIWDRAGYNQGFQWLWSTFGFDQGVPTDGGTAFLLPMLAYDYNVDRALEFMDNKKLYPSMDTMLNAMGGMLKLHANPDDIYKATGPYDELEAFLFEEGVVYGHEIRDFASMGRLYLDGNSLVVPFIDDYGGHFVPTLKTMLVALGQMTANFQPIIRAVSLDTNVNDPITAPVVGYPSVANGQIIPRLVLGYRGDNYSLKKGDFKIDGWITGDDFVNGGYAGTSNLTEIEAQNALPTLKYLRDDMWPQINAKQDKLPAKSTGNVAPKGNQAVVLDTAGSPSNVYTTAGKDLALTAKSGAQKVMNYVDGTTTLSTFATNQGLSQARVKSALVSLELLKDVYSEINAKITNNALPTGTTGTVVTYNGTNAQTGVQQFTETAISGTAAYDANDQLTNGNNIANVTLVETKQKKKECGGYEPAPAGQPAHDGTHPGDEDYCWLWIFPD